MLVIVSVANDPGICFQGNTEMLRFAQHDNLGFQQPVRGERRSRRQARTAPSRKAYQTLNCILSMLPKSASVGSRSWLAIILRAGSHQE